MTRRRYTHRRHTGITRDGLSNFDSLVLNRPADEFCLGFSLEPVVRTEHAVELGRVTGKRSAVESFKWEGNPRHEFEFRNRNDVHFARSTAYSKQICIGRDVQEESVITAQSIGADDI